MKIKKTVLCLLLCAALGAAALAAGGTEDPLVSLSYLAGTFSNTVDREIEQRFCNGARREMAHLPDVHQPADGDENRLQAQDHHPHNPDQAQLADPLQVESQAKPVLFHHTHSFPLQQ